MLLINSEYGVNPFLGWSYCLLVKDIDRTRNGYHTIDECAGRVACSVCRLGTPIREIENDDGITHVENRKTDEDA